MTPLPLPILTLRFSSPSFLETILTDAGHPVYSTETYQNSTSLSRCHPIHGLSLIASIRWPEFSSHKGKSKDLASTPQVLMDGCLKSEDDLLRRNVLNTSRKFHIPGHSQSLKWKRVQGVFQCTSSCGALVAVFEPAILTARARLNIFVPTLSGLPEPAGDPVSNILADYLIVTAILLLTHPEDWRGLAPSPSESESSPVMHIAPGYSTPVSPITSAYDEREHPLHEHHRRAQPYPQAQQQQQQYQQQQQHYRPQQQPQQQYKEPVVEYEPPPPYEEIQWTVRVRQPRPRRT